jgi:hypothetical protein
MDALVGSFPRRMCCTEVKGRRRRHQLTQTWAPVLLLAVFTGCEPTGSPRDRCQPESDAIFCARFEKTCGALTNLDNCGNTRTLECGECGAGGGAGGAGSRGGGDALKDAGAIELVPKAEVLLLIDKSFSMNSPIIPGCSGGACQTRVRELKTGVTQALATIPADMRFGLAFFPDPNAPVSFSPGGCAPTRSAAVPFPARDISDDDTARLSAVTTEVSRQIQSLGIDIPVSGGSPTSLSLRFASELFDLTDSRRDVIVLVTDGLPNCNPSNPLSCASMPPPPLDQCSLNSVPNPTTANNCVGEYCNAGYFDLAATLQVLSDLRSRGVSTVVIGLGSDVVASTQTVEAFNAMAVAGGLNRSCPNGTDAECGAGGTCSMNRMCLRQFFAASSGDDLRQILEALPPRLSDFGGGTGGGGAGGGVSQPTGGGSASACHASNCPSGCCNGNTCELGASNSLCGSGGRACSACGTGTTCQNRACKPTQPGCNAQSCPSGCCIGNTCQTGTANTGCGRGGGVCIACAGGSVCQNGTCQPMPNACGPQSCSGCCLRSGRCVSGADALACGRGGAECRGCTACREGVCLSSAPPNGGGDGGTGSTCTQSSQCANAAPFPPPIGETSLCVSDWAPDGTLTAWVSGYCSSTCKLGLCVGAGVCLSDSQCYSPCTQPGQGKSSCRVGYVCVQLYNGFADGGLGPPISGSGVCKPDCRNLNAVCSSGLRCSALGYCE